MSVKLQKVYGKSVSYPTLYRRAVGSLVYLMTTRLDISFATNLVSRFMTDPRHLHFAVVQRIIEYLQGTSDRGLFFFPKLLIFIRLLIVMMVWLVV